MNSRGTCIFCRLPVFCFLLLSGVARAEEVPELSRILEQINSINTFSMLYTGTVQIASFVPEKKTVVNSYSTYTKGLDNILLIQQAPKKDAGKKILLKQGKVWFYFPKARKAIVMNPRNTLLGTVSIGDVLSPPLLDVYTLNASETVMLDAGEAVKLEFVAQDSHSPYGTMVYYYQQNHIVASESYARSGILLKKARFYEFVTNAGGTEYASKIKIENGVNPEYYALIKVSDLEEVENLPDDYFMIEGLDKVGE